MNSSFSPEGLFFHWDNYWIVEVWTEGCGGQEHPHLVEKTSEPRKGISRNIVRCSVSRPGTTRKKCMFGTLTRETLTGSLVHTGMSFLTGW